ncbi:MAG: hypothetical protein ACREON_15580 [Gemmatimonadaceae bacterium]
MTLVVGILCKDGVVMASDSAATFGTSGIHTIGQQEVQKVQVLNDHILYSATGAVGISQLIADKLKAMWKELARLNSPEDVMDKIGKAILSIVGPYLQGAQYLRPFGGDGHFDLQVARRLIGRR